MPSTNDYATNLLAKSNPSEGTVISTYKQLQGKGQIGRGWFSDEGKNLSLSVIIRPSFLAVQDYFYLSMITALAVRKVVSDVICIGEVRIKWPNDIYIYNRKVAGLLIQQSLQGANIMNAILGIGLNVNQQQFPASIPNPISMSQAAQCSLELETIKMNLLKQISIYYGALRERKYIDIKREYLQYLYRRGELTTFIRGNDHFEGEILGIDVAGKLQVNSNNKIETFSMHEVRMKIPD